MANIYAILIIVLIIGLFAGFIGSILGIGGGMIVTPILTIILGLDIKYAIAASIVVVIATSSGSAIAYLKDRVINLRVAMFLEIFTSIGGLIGALLTGVFPSWILYILFSLLITYSIINMLLKLKKEKLGKIVEIKTDKIAKKLKLNSSYFDVNLNKKINYNVKNVPAGSIIMFGAGIMSGLLGIGSGVFKVIAMDGAMKMPLKPSSATSNFMMGVTAAASAIVYFLNGSILPEITVPVCLGVLVGATFGTRAMQKMHPIAIRMLFIIVMAYFCIQMITKAIGAF